MFALQLASVIESRALLAPLSDPTLRTCEGAHHIANDLGHVEVRMSRGITPPDLFRFLSHQDWAWSSRNLLWYAPLCRLNLEIARRISGRPEP